MDRKLWHLVSCRAAVYIKNQALTRATGTNMWMVRPMQLEVGVMVRPMQLEVGGKAANNLYTKRVAKFRT